MTSAAITATFTVDMTPGPEVVASSGRFDVTKTWSGGAEGTSRGVLLTGGDPAAGDAGYVAMEQFTGLLDGREGTVLFQQLGTMSEEEPLLQYVIAPGSGTGQLAGVTGTLAIDAVGDDGAHQVTFTLTRPA